MRPKINAQQDESAPECTLRTDDIPFLVAVRDIAVTPLHISESACLHKHFRVQRRAQQVGNSRSMLRN